MPIDDKTTGTSPTISVSLSKESNSERKQFSHYSARQIECWLLSRSNPQASQIEVQRCAHDDLTQQRIRLDTLLAEIRISLNDRIIKPSPANDLPSDLVEKFDQAQADWVGWVNRQCDWEAHLLFGNSVAPMVNISCRATYTTERIEHLRHFLCGDLPSADECEQAKKYRV